MATAGTPPSNTPSSARAASNMPQVGASAAPRLHTAASAIEANIKRRLSRPSDSAPAIKIAAARQPVLTDSANELPAAPRLKYSASSGSTGCTQYNSENVANPAKKRAKLMRRYAGEPACTQVRAAGGKGDACMGITVTRSRIFCRKQPAGKIAGSARACRC